MLIVSPQNLFTMTTQTLQAARAEQPTKQTGHPMATIAGFFARYNLQQTRSELERLSRLASGIAGRRRQRQSSRTARFTSALGELAAAAYTLHRQQNKKALIPPLPTTEKEEGTLAGFQPEKQPGRRRLPFEKAGRLIDQVPLNPMGVVQEVFHCLFIEDLRDDLLPKWLRVALGNESGIYVEGQDRGQLLVFYDELLVLIEALLVISESHLVEKKYAPVELEETFRQPKLLNEEQMNDPLSAIKQFCQRFDPEYVRRELWSLLEAGVNYSGPYPGGFHAGWAFSTYEYVSCLTEAAYYIAEDTRM